jgi:glycosyltransferase
MNSVFISVLIPTFNRSSDLRNCLKSVLDQDWTLNYEIIISENDHSNERATKKVLEEFSMLPINIFIQKKNLGMFGNWNFLIEKAKGEYFTLLNDDDVLLPMWTTVLSKINGRQMLGVLALENTPTNKLQSYENDSKHIFKDITLNDLYWGLWTNGTLGSVFHTDTCKDMGLFNPNLYPISDWDFYVRYIEKCGGKVSDKTLALFGKIDSSSMKIDTMLGDMEQSYFFRDQLIAKKKLKNNLTLQLIKNLFYAKKYSICRASNEYNDVHKFPNAVLSFTPTRILLRIFPMRLAKFLFK